MDRNRQSRMNVPLDSCITRTAPCDDAASRQPDITNARHNALDRARLRRACRLFDGAGSAAALAPKTITAADIRASRVLAGATDPPQE